MAAIIHAHAVRTGASDESIAGVVGWSADSGGGGGGVGGGGGGGAETPRRAAPAGGGTSGRCSAETPLLMTVKPIHAQRYA